MRLSHTIRNPLALTFFSLLFFVVAQTARADWVAFDNGAGGAAGINNLSASDSDAPLFLSDDFVVATSGIVTELYWTGSYVFGNNPVVDDFTISFYQDNGSGSPDINPFASFNVGNAITRTDSGIDLFIFDVYNYSATFRGPRINPGITYWVEISNNTAGASDNWFWGVRQTTGNANSRTSGTGAWATTTVQPDFGIMATVPEPGLGLGLFCCCGLGLLYRRPSRDKYTC